jgi:alkanesulfonate monooxygenase SsuD/methylene tetrahydromethanopterin reductase-like flavin-dependent oxidoreductase (luciferase family)
LLLPFVSPSVSSVSRRFEPRAFNRSGSAEAVSKVAQRVEALGYHSLFTVEGPLFPVKPQSPYAGMPDGSLPEPYKHGFDPLEALTFAAAQTKKVTLGTTR